MSRRFTRAPRGDDTGFTLVEMLIVLLILPIVIGGVTVAVITAFQNDNTTVSRISDSGDAQLVSAFYVHDVQSATNLTTDESATDPAVCASVAAAGASSFLLGLYWSPPGTTTASVVSYWEVTVTHGTTVTHRIDRNFCANASLTSTSPITPTSSSTLALDPSAGQPSPNITCASTVAANCAGTTPPYQSGWVPTAGISGVTLASSEPGSGFSYNLLAAPRSWTPASGGVAGQQGSPVPFLLLTNGGSCSAPALTETGNADVTVVSGGSPAPVGLDSPCAGAISLSNSAKLNVSQVVTADQNLNSITCSGNPTGCSTTQTYVSGGPANPLSGLATPTNPTPVSSPTQACSVTTPGAYTSACTYNNGTTTFAGGGTYTFNSTVSIASNENITFGSGTYIFKGAVNMSNDHCVKFSGGTYWFEGGLSLAGTTYNVPNCSGGAYSDSFQGTFIFGTTTTGTGNGLSVSNGAIITTPAVGALFYIEGGSATFGGGSSGTLSPLTGEDGVVIWDAASSGTTNPLTLSNGSSVNALNVGGAIYVPNGEIDFGGNGNMRMSSVIANTAVLGNSGSLSISS